LSLLAAAVTARDYFHARFGDADIGQPASYFIAQPFALAVALSVDSLPSVWNKPRDIAAACTAKLTLPLVGNVGRLEIAKPQESTTDAEVLSAFWQNTWTLLAVS
jgi:hypothetical protein